MCNKHSVDKDNNLQIDRSSQPFLCSLQAAADSLGGISVRTISRMIARKELVGVSVGRRSMVLISSIDDWVVQQIKKRRSELS